MSKNFILILIVLTILSLVTFFINIFNSDKIKNKNESKTNMNIISKSFENESKIPEKYTCDGENINPNLEISSVPSNSKSLLLIMDDPDASFGIWDHWILYNIDPSVTTIEENSIPSKAKQGKNSWGKIEYGGPCPAKGTHRYIFRLYALDIELNLDEGATKDEVLNATANHVLEKSELIGLYK